MDVNFYIALYGALLSTGLFIHKILKDRKKLSIILEHIAWVEKFQIIITNSGNRPITLTGISMKVIMCEDENSNWQTIPQMDLFDQSQKTYPFPVIINAREAISLPLESTISGYHLKSTKTVCLSIYDSEGKEYSEFKTRTYDAKWGFYT
ncbi:MAG: hypothetical protein K0B14_17935 [Anaerolineaceae bacterium]|nr:hypothetical protein [Anaerolineaceae bacterium]